MIFVSTEKYNFCLLRYNESSKLVETVATGSLRDRCCRPADAGQLVSVDGEGRLLVLHLFQGLLKILPVDSRGKDKEAEVRFKEPFNVRLEELQVHSITLLLDSSKPTLAVLHETIQGKREIVSHVIEADKRLGEGPFRFEVDERSHMLIPVPKPRGGVLIIADTCIQYYKRESEGQQSKEIKLCCSYSNLSKIVAVTRIDADGFRYLFGDQRGALSLLVLRADEGGMVKEMKLEYLGQASVPSSLEYVDGGRVFVGSRLGPNQLVQLRSDRNAEGSFVDVIRVQETLSPVLDMCLVDRDHTGNPDTLVACSGAFAAGGLSVVRRGVGVDVSGSFSLSEEEDVTPVTAAWPLDLQGSGKTDHMAIVTPLGTELLSLDITNGIIEPSPSQQKQPMLVSSNSIFVGQMGPIVLQVTPASINYKSCLPGSQRRIWLPQNGVSILGACLDEAEGLVMVSLSNNYLVLFDLKVPERADSVPPELIQRRSLLLPSLPSAVSMARAESGLYAFVGLWGSVDPSTGGDPTRPFSVVAIDLLHAFSTPQPIYRGLAEVPRSIACTLLKGVSFLFVALPSGSVAYGRLEKGTNGLSLKEERESLLGSQPSILLPMDSGLFILSDRPCLVVASAGGQPHFLSAPLTDLRIFCPLRLGAASPGSFLAGNGAGEFTIGRLDASQSRTRLHVDRVPMGETLRRLVHLPEQGLFAVLALRPAPDAADMLSSQDASSLCLLSDRTFEIVDRYVLPMGQSAQCLLFTKLAGVDTLLVGTAMADASGSFQSPKGHILAFRLAAIHDATRRPVRLSLAHSHFLPGAVYSLAWTRDRLVATVNGSTVLLKWEETGKAMRWRELYQHHGQIVGIHIDALDDLLAVGDMMRSADLLQLNQEGDRLTEIARDYYTGWATHCRLVDREHVLLADDHGNLSQLTLTRDPNFVVDRLVLEHSAAFHIGSIINTIVRGSLSEPGTGKGSGQGAGLFKSSFLWGTACGTLGSLAVLRDQGLYELLAFLQKNILAVAKSAGHFNHSEWRSFYNEKRALSGHAHFIDGDVIQRFHSLPDALQKAVVYGGSHHCVRLPGDRQLCEIAELVDHLTAY